jgi:putative MATE family efflux protein
MKQTQSFDRPMFTPASLRRLIIPLIIEQMLAVTVGLADTVMIASVGEAAVSGVSLVNSLNNLIISILAALCTGGAVVCAQYLGRQDVFNARSSAKQLVYVSLFFTVVVGAVLLSSRNFFIRVLFGEIEADVHANASTYLLLTSLSFPFLAVYNACAALFRSMGNSRVSLFASAIMNIINVGGNALLIYGCGLGVAGAGTATLVSRAVAAVLMLVLIANPANAIHLRRVWKVRLDVKLIKSILSIGVPNGFENGLFNFGKLIVQSMVSTLGTAAIAANAILGSIANIVFVPGMSMGLAMVTVVGQCIGAGDYAQAKYYVKKMMLLTHIVLIAINVPLLFLNQWVVGWFPLSADAVAVCLRILPVLSVLLMTIWPYSFALPNALRAAGDARFTMTVSAVSMWTLRVGLCYVFIRYFNLGVAGVWYSMFIDWVGRLSFFIPRYLRGKWQTKTVIH